MYSTVHTGFSLLPSALVDNPLLPIPMPCKPAFYGLAWPVVGGNLPTDKLDTYLAKHDPAKSMRLEIRLSLRAVASFHGLWAGSLGLV